MLNRTVVVGSILSLICVAYSCGRAQERDAITSALVAGKTASTSPFDGKWEVCSASYQLSGPIIYTFQGDALTVESRQAVEKCLDSPRIVSKTKWRIKIDEAKSPRRLIMKKTDPADTSNGIWTEAYEFRDGELWMCRDFGDPITSDSLRPGTGGWITGLRRVK